MLPYTTFWSGLLATALTTGGCGSSASHTPETKQPMDGGLEAGVSDAAMMPDADAGDEVTQQQVACEVPLFDAQNPCFHTATELMAATPVADYLTDYCYPYVRIRMSPPGGSITCLYGGDVMLVAWERWSLTTPAYCNGKGWGIFAPVLNVPAGSVSGCMQADGATVIGTDGNPLPGAGAP